MCTVIPGIDDVVDVDDVEDDAVVVDDVEFEFDCCICCC